MQTSSNMRCIFSYKQLYNSAIIQLSSVLIHTHVFFIICSCSLLGSVWGKRVVVCTKETPASAAVTPGRNRAGVPGIWIWGARSNPRPGVSTRSQQEVSGESGFTKNKSGIKALFCFCVCGGLVRCLLLGQSSGIDSRCFCFSNLH